MKLKQNGSLLDNHGLWYYSVRLPGESKRRLVPLRAPGSKHTMRTDRPRKMAKEAAARYWEEHTRQPKCVLAKSDSERKSYLDEIYRTIYIRDIIERNKIKEPAILESLLDVVMSGIGGLTNPNKISDTMNTEAKMKTNNVTISKYLDLLENAFLIAKAKRYDVKGRRHLKSLNKYYTIDPGLRNARVNFRQNEQTHLMENVIYNELIRRGYSVDVGIVQLETRAFGKHEMRQYEIDFVVNKADERIYIQSAYAIPDDKKRAQETFSLRHVNDNFRKVVITGNIHEKPWHDNDGITFIGIVPFLLDPNSLETL